MSGTDKHTKQKKDHIGEIYLYKDNKIEVGKQFVYKESAFKYWKNGYCFFGETEKKSKKMPDLEDDIKVYDGYEIKKERELLKVPYEFVIDNNLEKCEE